MSRMNAGARVIVAIVIGFVLVGGGLLMRMWIAPFKTADLQPSATATAPSATTRPATAPVGGSFDARYSLNDGEVLRRVAPPFPPERAERLLSQVYHGGNLPTGDLSAHGTAVYYWQEPGNLQRWSFSGGTGTAASAICECLDLQRYELDVSRELLFQPLLGDWIIRRPSTVEERLAALAPILARLPKPLKLEKRRDEREVIVVRGMFEFHPLPGPNDPAVNGMVLVIGPGDLTRPPTEAEMERDPARRLLNNGGGSGTLATCLSNLAGLVNQHIVDETNDGERRVGWRYHAGTIDDHGEGRDSMLDNLSRQTTLKFSREVRIVDVWVAAEGK